jgi:arylsulfatase A-like enzyme
VVGSRNSLGISSGAQTPSARPNILFIIADDAELRSGGARRCAVRTRLCCRTVLHAVSRVAADRPSFDAFIEKVSVGDFGDIDGGMSKDLLLAHRSDAAIARYFKLVTEKRPAEELYDLRSDPAELDNLATKPGYASAKKQLRDWLDRWMRDTGDPRAIADDDRWDRYPFFGNPGK